MLSWPLYPGYRTHRPWHPLVEYAGWLPRLVRQRLTRGRRARAFAAAVAAAKNAYLFPLQLDCDFQIRRHSEFCGMAEAIEEVVSSFLRNAPRETCLIVKEHPLDNGLTDWRAVTRAAARRHGQPERIIYLPQGAIEPLLERVRGVVTVNSTSGLLALGFDRPVVALGRAIYDLPRLTHQDGLDTFWRAGVAPDRVAFDAFRRVVATRTQVNGGFFSKPGIDLAVAGALARIGVAPAIEDRPRAPNTAPQSPADVQILMTN
jgi:capsular polysaccharide export protein